MLGTRRHAHTVFAHDELAAAEAEAGIRRRQRGVEFAMFDRVVEQVGSVDAQCHAQARPQPHQVRQHAHHQRIGVGVGHAHAQQAGVLRAQVARQALELVVLGVVAPGRVEEQPPFRREPHPARRAFEQIHADGGLEPAHGLGQGRLADAHLLRGAAEVLLARGFEKVGRCRWERKPCPEVISSGATGRRRPGELRPGGG